MLQYTPFTIWSGSDGYDVKGSDSHGGVTTSNPCLATNQDDIKHHSEICLFYQYDQFVIDANSCFSWRHSNLLEIKIDLNVTINDNDSHSCSKTDSINLFPDQLPLDVSLGAMNFY